LRQRVLQRTHRIVWRCARRGNAVGFIWRRCCACWFDSSAVYGLYLSAVHALVLLFAHCSPFMALACWRFCALASQSARRAIVGAWHVGVWFMATPFARVFVVASFQQSTRMFGGAA